jgi:hypothetical protein
MLRRRKSLAFGLLLIALQFGLLHAARQGRSGQAPPAQGQAIAVRWKDAGEYCKIASAACVLRVYKKPPTGSGVVVLQGSQPPILTVAPSGVVRDDEPTKIA